MTRVTLSCTNFTIEHLFDENPPAGRIHLHLRAAFSDVRWTCRVLNGICGVFLSFFHIHIVIAGFNIRRSFAMEQAEDAKRLGVIGIVITDREQAAPKVNEILSRHGRAVIGRIGLPYKERGVNVISLIVEAGTDELGALTGRLGMLDGVRVKSLLV